MSMRILSLLLVGALVTAASGSTLAQARVGQTEQPTLGADLGSPLPLHDGVWPDWGQPPQDQWDAAEEWPPLPQARGWARFQAMGYAFNWHDVFAAGAGVVVLNDYGGDAGYQLSAFSLSDGAPVWTAIVKGLDQYSLHLITEDTLLCTWQYVDGDMAEESVAALDAATGQTLWTRRNVRLLTAGAAGAWVTNRVDPDPGEKTSDEQPLADLLLLNLTDGREVQNFKIGRLVGFAQQIPADGRTMAVATAKELFVCSADGLTRPIARTRLAWDARLALDESSLLEVATPPILGTEEVSKLLENMELNSPEAEDFFTNSDYAKAISTGELLQYNLATGKLLWEASFTPKETYGARVLEPRLGSGVAAVVGRQGVDLFTRSTGEKIMIAELDDTTYLDTKILGDQILVGEMTIPGDSVPQHAPKLVSLRDGSAQDMPVVAREWRLSQIVPGFVCYNASGPGSLGQDEDLPGCTATVCIEVDDEWRPVPGSLALLNPPEEYADLVRDFVASSSPLHDSAMMTRVVAAGQRGLHQILKAVRPDHEAQLEALAYAAVYMVDRQNGYSRASNVLVYHLRGMSTAVEPMLLRWQADPQLALLHEQIGTLLLQAGGSESAGFAARKFPLPDYAPLAPPKAPFAIAPQDSWLRGTGDNADGEEYEVMQWTEAVGPDGARYAVFTGWGLIGIQDITIGIDSNNDGSFEEVFPTGFSDLCYMQFYPGGIALYSSGPGVRLTLDLPRLTISHHTPELEFDQEYKYANLTGATFGETTVDLNELRRDSDGDGFTDITERMLLLDPQKTDTDGDGTPDLTDATPNADPAQMGKLERGIARGLQYYFDSVAASNSRYYHDSGDDERVTLPYATEFVEVHGAGPVALALHGERTICISSDEQFRTYASYGGGLPTGGGISVRVGNDSTWEDTHTADAKPVPWGLNLSLTSFGAFVELKEVDGEYYPVRHYDTWIS